MLGVIQGREVRGPAFACLDFCYQALPLVDVRGLARVVIKATECPGFIEFEVRGLARVVIIIPRFIEFEVTFGLHHLMARLARGRDAPSPPTATRHLRK